MLKAFTLHLGDRALIDQTEHAWHNSKWLSLRVLWRWRWWNLNLKQQRQQKANFDRRLKRRWRSCNRFKQISHKSSAVNLTSFQRPDSWCHDPWNWPQTKNRKPKAKRKSEIPETKIWESTHYHLALKFLDWGFITSRVKIYWKFSIEK